MRTRRLVLVAACTPLVALLSGPRARAQGSDVALRIDCTELDQASRAALEARARAELTSAPPRPGEVTIGCHGGSAAVAWQPRGESRRESQVRLPSDAASAVEVLLEALDALLFEKRAASTTSDRASEPASGAQASPPASSETAPVAAPVSVATARAPIPDAGEPGQSGLALAVTLGGDSELWRGAIPGGLGAHVGGRLQVPGGWGITLAGGALWGLGSAQGLTSRTLRLVAGVDYLIVPHVRVGVAAEGRLMTVEGDPSVAPSSLDGITAGALLSARYSVEMGALELSVGPQAEILARPLIAQMGTSEVFRIPTALVGLVVDVSVRFDR